MVKSKVRNINVYGTHRPGIIQIQRAEAATGENLDFLTLECISTIRVKGTRCNALNLITQANRKTTTVNRLRKKLAERNHQSE